MSVAPRPWNTVSYVAGIGVAVLVAVGTVGESVSSLFSDTIAPALE